MADRHGNHAGGDVVARVHRDAPASALSTEDIAHVRVLALESLAREGGYLVQHAEAAWMDDDVRGGEDAATTSQHVRKTFSVLDHLGWAG